MGDQAATDGCGHHSPRRAGGAAAANHDGHVFATGGDSFGVAFHRTADAAAWATDLQTAISTEPWPGNLEIRLRIGLHTGEAEERGDSYFGPAVNTAARIAATGHGGQTLVSGLTSALLGGDDLLELGAFRLDGVVGEQHIAAAGRPSGGYLDYRQALVSMGHLLGQQAEAGPSRRSEESGQ